jgi:protein-S-isoprenylcysteine O-methyltransferase Ste14
MAQSSSSVSPPVSMEVGQFGRAIDAVAWFLIRRRILLSGILFGLMIGKDFYLGVKPHDPIDFRDPASVTGVVLVVVGLALRSWAAGILRKDAELTMTGPYRLIRNPLYVGSFLMMFGFCALIGSVENLLFIAGPILLIYAIKVRQEERLLAQLFPAQWTGYFQSTPRFIPRPARADISCDWRVSQWLHAREYQAVLTTLAALVAVMLWHSM